MFNHTFTIIYHLFLHGGGQHVGWIEKYLEYDDSVELTHDDIRNESGAYESLFDDENRAEFELLYYSLLHGMKELTYEQSGSMLSALEFLQYVVATGLWKYHQNVGKPLEEFAREFDRLDVPAERVRLYEKAKFS